MRYPAGCLSAAYRDGSWSKTPNNSSRRGPVHWLLVGASLLHPLLTPLPCQPATPTPREPRQRKPMTTTTNPTLSLITLRPIPSSPWIRTEWVYGHTWLDLRGLLPDGAEVETVTLNGVALKLSRQQGCRTDTDHPHLFRVSPPVRLEGDRLVVAVRLPAEAPQSPVTPLPKMAGSYPSPDLEYGLQSRP
jgi:hypothetical protein